MRKTASCRGFQVLAILFFSATPASMLCAQDVSLPSAPAAQTGLRLQTTADLQQDLKPRSYFPRVLAPYQPQHMTPISLRNTPRIEQLMHDGRLYLSINDAIAIALENNLDLAIARINPKIAETDIWRAQAGSSIGGVNAGIVQNTPGGTGGGVGGQLGAGEGGTTGGAGGAGVGLGGIVSSTFGGGSQVSSFDPALTASFQVDRLKSQCNTPLCATNQNTTSANLTYTQGFQWGTDMSVEFDNNRVSSNSDYNYLSPALNSNLQVRLTQHLLQGFGLATNTRFIRMARNNQKISDVAFRSQIVSTVNQIENMYWDLVAAYENLKVQEKQMEFARQLLVNNKKQMEIGSLALIEVVKAQSAIAVDQQSLTQARTNLELAQLLIKNAIARTLEDPLLVDAEVIPTSTIEISAVEPGESTQSLMDQAFRLRPDLEEANINLANSQINRKAIENSLLPTADLSAYYGGSGLGGTQNPDYLCFSNPQVCGLKVPPPALGSVSFGSTLGQLFDSTASDKGVSVSLTIPIRNRAAQATQIRSQLESRQSEYLIQQLQNLIRMQVKNAQFGLQQSRATVDAAQAAVDLARQSLDVEQKKFEIRAATSISVLQNQAELVQAEGQLIAAKIAYAKAALQLDQATGRLLQRAGISIADAQRGQVMQLPAVPNAVATPAEPAPSGNPGRN